MIQWLQKNDDDDVECDDNFNEGTDESSKFCKTLTSDKNFDTSIYNLTCAKVHYYKLHAYQFWWFSSNPHISEESPSFSLSIYCSKVSTSKWSSYLHLMVANFCPLILFYVYSYIFF